MSQEKKSGSQLPIQWSNRDNVSFYTKLGVDGLKIRAQQCGLEHCPDLSCLATFLESHGTRVSNILEIGAGYGRVGQWLIQKYPAARLSLMELNPSYAQHLRESFLSNPDVAIFQQDLLNATLITKQDLVVWMWAGCLDFASHQKQAALNKAASIMAPQGILAIEVPQTTEDVVKRGNNGNISADLLGHRYNGHIPSSTELIEWGNLAGLVLITTLFYETSTGLKRAIFVFQKPEVE